jgi:hypothetical protein
VDRARRTGAVLDEDGLPEAAARDFAEGAEM